MISRNLTYSVLWEVELFPNNLQAVFGAFNLQDKKENPVVLDLAHLAYDPVDRMPSIISKSHIIT